MRISESKYSSPAKYFKRCLQLFNRIDQCKIILLAILQVLAGFLDLIGVALIGVLGALGVSGIQSREPGNRVNQVLSFLNISNLTFQQQALVLAGSATIVLTSRTIVSVFLTRKALNFLSNRAAGISSILSSKILNSELSNVKLVSSQEILYKLTSGVEILLLVVMGTLIGLVSDVSLLIVISLGLFLIDPSVAISTFVLFVGIAFALYKIVSGKARHAGAQNMKLKIQSSEIILEAFDSYQVAIVRDRRQYYVDQISRSRYNLAKTQADLQFMPSITKYVIESVMLFGVLLIAGLQYALKDAVNATATMALFMAASSRIAPAVMRIQQGGVQIKSNAGSANSTLDLIDELSASEPLQDAGRDIAKREDFIPEITVHDISASFGTSQNDVLKNVSLNFKPGTLTAIVGPSGAGKSTLIDAILGIKSLKKGNVFVSGLTPLQAFSRWPSEVGFVPQVTFLKKGSIRENIALGYPKDEINDDAVVEAIHKAQLGDFLANFENGIYAEIGEDGLTVSGGQRQRLGIARALYANPSIVILDEATSALDAVTEHSITEAVKRLKGSVTLIVVAHRLSTIKDADTVVYMAEGSVVAVGSFEEVRNLVPDFEEQALIMGL